MPPHRITLKVGMVIMLLWNFDQENGHCNDSRYIIEQILPHLLVGVNAGRTLLIYKSADTVNTLWQQTI